MSSSYVIKYTTNGDQPETIAVENTQIIKHRSGVYRDDIDTLALVKKEKNHPKKTKHPLHK